VSESHRLEEWEGRTIDQWQARWRVPAVIALTRTGSTNDIARAMAEEGAPAGLLVMTEHQTAGRGRMKRTWADTPGRSLLLSFVLRPGITGDARPDAAHAARGREAPSGVAETGSSGATVRAGGTAGSLAPGTAPLRVGIALAGALRQAADIDARLKWPNDVVTPGGKVAGILCEAASAGGETVIIAGIGINVLQQRDEWPAQLRELAISVAQVAPLNAAGRAEIMDAVVAAMHPLFTRPLEPLGDDELRAYADIDALRGLDVTASGTGHIRGTAAGIAADGALLIEAGGVVRRITSGTVRVTGPSTPTTAWMPR
jgi:BirA family biotin operon repressor/biotin-[acetyl-CoA-carboxylase] ligase